MSELRRHIMMQAAGGGSADIPLLAIQGINAFINTGIQVNSTTDIDVKFAMEGIVQNLFSGGGDVWSAQTSIEISSYYIRYGNYWINKDNWGFAHIYGVGNINNWTRFQIMHDGNMYYESLAGYPPGVTTFTTSTFVGNVNFPMVIGALWRGGAINTHNTKLVRFYHFKMYKNGVLILDLVPIIRNGKAGMRDNLTDIFYSSENQDEEFEPVYG